MSNIKDYYYIDEHGKVYSKFSGNLLELKQCIDRYGYSTISLQAINGERKNYTVHRLVALTYIPNTNNFPVVMHIDNNKRNNHVSNLKWGTVQTNTQEAYNDGLCDTTTVSIWVRNKNTKQEKIYNSVSEFCREYGFSVGYVERISRIAQGKLPHPTRGRLINLEIKEI